MQHAAGSLIPHTCCQRTPTTSYSPYSTNTYDGNSLLGRPKNRERTRDRALRHGPPYPAEGPSRCSTHASQKAGGHRQSALRLVKRVGLTHGPCMKRDCLNNAGAWNEQWFCRRPTGRLYHIFVTRHWFLGATNRRELVQCGASSASFRVPGMLTGRFPWWPSLVSQFGIQNTPTRGTLKSTGRPSQFQMLACPAQCLPVL